jgi:hypothetical protein
MKKVRKKWEKPAVSSLAEPLLSAEQVKGKEETMYIH